MTRKRKQSRTLPGDGGGNLPGAGDDSTLPSKRRCGVESDTARTPKQPSPSSVSETPPAVSHPVLSLYFPGLCTLRSYLVSAAGGYGRTKGHRSTSLQNISPENDKQLSDLLDSALVGPLNLGAQQRRIDPIQETPGPGARSQSEIVDYAIQLFFSKPRRQGSRFDKPSNVLAIGYKRDPCGEGNLVRLTCTHPNCHVNTLKREPWKRLRAIVGHQPMTRLLTDTSIFIPLGGTEGRESYYQLVGPALSEAPLPQVKEPSFNSAGIKNDSSAHCPTAPKRGSPVPQRQRAAHSTGLTLSKPGNGFTPSKARAQKHKLPPDPVTPLGPPPKKLKTAPSALVVQNATKAKKVQTPGDILFVRSRMFYAKPAYNGRGEVVFGLRHIHVLNRFSNPWEDSQVHHILMYIFPRQFGLHNAFTSSVDRNETVQPFKDYTMREHEIADKTPKDGKRLPMPKRLRGTVTALVRKLMKLQKRTAYNALVRYYCPVAACDPGVNDKRICLKQSPCPVAKKGSVVLTQARRKSIQIPSSHPAVTSSEPDNDKERFADYASSPAEVSAFARSVLHNAIPKAFWGSEENKKLIMCSVETFVKLRRYETLSLHLVLQDVKLADFDWLRPPSIPATAKMSASDGNKRHELLNEFAYWLFDSFLIPLLRSNFYITESHTSRNRVLYFRHDVWKRLSEPALNLIKLDMFEELKNFDPAKAKGSLGVGALRLLPKDMGVRPILNLKRRSAQKGKYGKSRLGESTNQLLRPLYSVLNFEKSRNPEKLGASMSSVGDIYTHLSSFQSRLHKLNKMGQKLYFVKVDVTKCFDTIPQEALLKLIETILEEEEYVQSKHSEVRAPQERQRDLRKGVLKPGRRWIHSAKSADDIDEFSEVAAKIAKKRRHATIICEQEFPNKKKDQFQARDVLLKLLKEHVTNNTIKIGKKYYRQKRGIPQGSCLSSLLCNFFYGSLESSMLPFTSDQASVLLRLIDDFLFITLSRPCATRFLELMHAGHPDYGAFVKPEKTLVNFETSVNDKKVQNLIGTKEFPYCGNLVHTETLDVRKDRERNECTRVSDGLTVEYSRSPGRYLMRKAVAAFTLQTQRLFMDASFNSHATVVKNVWHSFYEVAMKFHQYVRSLASKAGRIKQKVFIETMEGFLSVAFKVLRGKRDQEDVACLGRELVYWLGVRAFRMVLAKKQSAYRDLLAWLWARERKWGKEMGWKERTRLPELEVGAFDGYRY